MNLTNVKGVTARVASNKTGGQITLHAGFPENEAFAIIDVPVTEAVSYTIPNTKVEATELGYVDVVAELKSQVSGVHDLYVVFHSPDLRIDSLAFNRSSTTLPVTVPDDVQPVEEESDMIIVTNPNIDTSGNIQIELPVDKKEIILSANSKVLQESVGLTATTENAVIMIPAAVLKQLMSLVSLEELSEANISLTLDTIEAEQVGQQLTKSSQLAQAKLMDAGAMVVIKLVLKKKNGEELELEKNATAITLKLKLNKGVQSDLAAIYSITDNGAIKYMSSEVEDGWMTTEAESNGMYALIEYNKTFTDVTAEHWAYQVIRSLAAKQIITGISMEQFAPNRPVSRAEFTALIRKNHIVNDGNWCFV